MSYLMSYIKLNDLILWMLGNSEIFEKPQNLGGDTA